MPIFGDRVLDSGEQVAVAVDEKIALRFQLVDPVTKAPRLGLEDVEILTFRAPGRSQKRQLARQVGRGVYQVEFEPAEAGVYYAFVECASVGLRSNASRPMILVANDG